MSNRVLKINWDNAAHVSLAQRAAEVIRKTQGRIIRNRVILALSIPGIGLALAIFGEARSNNDTELLIVSVVIFTLSVLAAAAALIIGKVQHNRAETLLFEARGAFGIETEHIREIAYASIAVDRIPNQRSAKRISMFLAKLRSFYPLVVGRLTDQPTVESKEDLEARYGDDIRKAREHGILP